MREGARRRKIKREAEKEAEVRRERETVQSLGRAGRKVGSEARSTPRPSLPKRIPGVGVGALTHLLRAAP